MQCQQLACIWWLGQGGCERQAWQVGWLQEGWLDKLQVGLGKSCIGACHRGWPSGSFESPHGSSFESLHSGSSGRPSHNPCCPCTPSACASLAPQAHALQLPTALAALESDLEVHECEMLQAHVWRSLRKAAGAAPGAESAAVSGRGPAAVAGTGVAAAAAPVAPAGCSSNPLLQSGLWPLLMADWVLLHAGHEQLRPCSLLPLAAQVYAVAGACACC